MLRGGRIDGAIFHLPKKLAYLAVSHHTVNPHPTNSFLRNYHISEVGGTDDEDVAPPYPQMSAGIYFWM
jgi:hypothetical protein